MADVEISFSGRQLKIVMFFIVNIIPHSIPIILTNYTPINFPVGWISDEEQQFRKSFYTSNVSAIGTCS